MHDLNVFHRAQLNALDSEQARVRYNIELSRREGTQVLHDTHVPAEFLRYASYDEVISVSTHKAQGLIKAQGKRENVVCWTLLFPMQHAAESAQSTPSSSPINHDVEKYIHAFRSRTSNIVRMPWPLSQEDMEAFLHGTNTKVLEKTDAEGDYVVVSPISGLRLRWIRPSPFD